MSSDFESYEQDFAVLTAEITGRIGKVPKLVGGERRAPAAAGGAARLAPRRGRRRPACWAPTCAALRLHGSRSAPQARPARLQEPLRLPEPPASQQQGLGVVAGGVSVFSAWSVSVSRHPNVFSCSLHSRVRIHLPAPGAHLFEQRVVS